jgi:pimeloyl-ACP methyl ester carboxylesterase
VALAYAEQYPDEVSQLVLVAPVVFPELRPLEHALFGSRAIPLFGPLLAHLATPFDRPLLEMLHHLMFAPDRPHEDWKETYPWRDVLNSRQSVAEGEDFASIHPLGSADTPNVREIRTPTQILVGEGDLIVDNERQGKRLARILPNARLTSLPRVGHMLHHSRSDLIVAAVRTALGN